jgi:hypothetical protein
VNKRQARLFLLTGMLGIVVFIIMAWAFLEATAPRLEQRYHCDETCRTLSEIRYRLENDFL